MIVGVVVVFVMKDVGIGGVSFLGLIVMEMLNVKLEVFVNVVKIN